MGELHIFDYIGGEYQLLSEIKHGDSSNLYLLYDKACGRKVLLKSGRPDLIENEARILTKFSEKGLPEIYHCFEREGTAYLFRQYIEGRTLRECMETDGAFPLKKTVQIGIAVCRIIAGLHKCDPPVIHRDIKSDNIILTRDGEVYIIDFGIAREFNPAASRDTVVMGTPSKAPPEQFGYGQTDVRSDVYAVGVLLHEMITGEDALDRGTSPRSISGIVKRCTMFSPDDRYRSIDNIERALKRLLGRKKRLMGAMAGCAALSLVFALAGGGQFKKEISKAPENKTEASKGAENIVEVFKTPESEAKASREPEGTAEASKKLVSKAEASKKPKKKTQATKEPKGKTEASSEPEKKMVVSKEPEKKAEASKAPKKKTEVSKNSAKKAKASKEPASKAKATKEPEVVYFVPIDDYYPGNYVLTGNTISKDILEKFNGDVKLTLEIEVGNLYPYANFVVVGYVGENSQWRDLKDEIRCSYNRNEDGYIDVDKFVGAKERQTECVLILSHDFIPSLQKKGIGFRGINVTVKRVYLSAAD